MKIYLYPGLHIEIIHRMFGIITSFSLSEEKGLPKISSVKKLSVKNS